MCFSSSFCVSSYLPEFHSVVHHHEHNHGVREALTAHVSWRLRIIEPYRSEHFLQYSLLTAQFAVQHRNRRSVVKLLSYNSSLKKRTDEFVLVVFLPLFVVGLYCLFLCTRTSDHHLQSGDLLRLSFSCSIDLKRCSGIQDDLFE